MKKIHTLLKRRKFIGKIAFFCLLITVAVAMVFVTLIMFGTNESVQKSLNVTIIFLIVDAVLFLLLYIVSCIYRKAVKNFLKNKINMLFKKYSEDARVVLLKNAIIEERYDIYISDLIQYRTETCIRKEVKRLKKDLKQITKEDVKLAVHHMDGGFLFTI